MPAEVCAAVVWGGEDLDILFVSTGMSILVLSFRVICGIIFHDSISTGDVPRDFYSGTNLSSDILSPGSGKIYKVTGLNATGVRQRPVCSKKPECE